MNFSRPNLGLPNLNDSLSKSSFSAGSSRSSGSSDSGPAISEPAHNNAHFKVTFHSDTDRGFASRLGSLTFESCTGLVTEIGVNYIGDANRGMGSRAVRSNQVTGKISFGKTVQGGNNEFSKWLSDVLDPNKRLKRMNLIITIKLIENSNVILEKWRVSNAWPCSWSGPLLDQSVPGLALHTITFVHEGVSLTQE
jgi:phage tail-like protein